MLLSPPRARPSGCGRHAGFALSPLPSTAIIGVKFEGCFKYRDESKMNRISKIRLLRGLPTIAKHAIIGGILAIRRRSSQAEPGAKVCPRRRSYVIINH